MRGRPAGKLLAVKLKAEDIVTLNGYIWNINFTDS